MKAGLEQPPKNKNLEEEHASNDAAIEVEKTPREIFEEILTTAEHFQLEGDVEAAHKYAHETYEKYFSFSPNLFDRLSPKDAFEVLIRINRIDALQGPVGQGGVGSFVFNLSGFAYSTKDRGEVKIHSFIRSILEGKNVSGQVVALEQLQTIAASALAEGSWGEPVYDAIRSYLKTEEKDDPFLLSTLKERLDDRLAREEENPTMGVVTTIENQHKSLMFEDNPFDERTNQIINDRFSFGTFSTVRTSPIARDYLGLFDSRNRLGALVPTKELSPERIEEASQVTPECPLSTLFEFARILRDRHYPATNKTVTGFSLGVFNPKEDGRLIDLLAAEIPFPKEDLITILGNERTYSMHEKDGTPVPDEVRRISDAFYAKLRTLPLSSDPSFTDALYAAYNAHRAARLADRTPIDILDLRDPRKLGFLGITADTIELFKVLQDPSFTKKINEKLGINLSHLDVRAQTAMLSYLATETEESVDHLAELIQTFDDDDREKICSAYLAFEKDKELGYIVENLCEIPEMATPVMRLVYKFIGNAGAMEGFLLTEFKTRDSRTAIAALYEKLITRARDILLHYNYRKSNLDDMKEIAWGQEMLNGYKDEPNSGSRQHNYREVADATEKKLIAEAEEEFAKANTDQVIFLSTCRALREIGELRLEDIRSASLSSEGAADFSKKHEDIAKVKSLMNAAYAQMPNTFRTAVVGAFDASLSNADTNFYVLRRNKDLVALVRFDTRRNDEGDVIEKYVGSLVSDPNYGNGKIGETLFETAMVKESAGCLIRGHANPRAPITQKYIEMGCIADGLIDYSGVESFSFSLDNTPEKRLYKTKTWSRERVIAAVRDQNDENIKAFAVNSPDEIPLRLLTEGYVLTRYFTENKRLIAVFEKKD